MYILHLKDRSDVIGKGEYWFMENISLQSHLYKFKCERSLGAARSSAREESMCYSTMLCACIRYVLFN